MPCYIEIAKTYVQVANTRDVRRRGKWKKKHAYAVSVGIASGPDKVTRHPEPSRYAYTKAEATQLAERMAARHGCSLHPYWGRVR